MALRSKPARIVQPELSAKVQHALKNRRPLLHHLNPDTSWLLQLPHRQGSKSTGISVERHWFNVIIDPWLAGSQSDVASWFSEQWHASESETSSISAVEELLREIEVISGNKELSGQMDAELKPAETMIDVVAISHEFTDHMHKDTLLQCHTSTLVMATSKAARAIRRWKHFDAVYETLSFPQRHSIDWRLAAGPPLPEWLAIARLVSPRNALYYHSALLFVFQLEGDGVAEALIYTPHGVHTRELRIVKEEASPPVRPLAFLHGLHDIKLSGKQLNLGAHNALQGQRILQAKYWIPTHDEIKKAAGLVSHGLRRKVISVQDALELESKTSSMSDPKDIVTGVEMSFVELANGDVKVLS